MRCSLIFFPFGVSTRTLTRRSEGLGWRFTRPASSRRSVGSTTVDGLHFSRAARSFCEIGCSGSSWTSAQADTGERPTASAASVARCSQPANDAITAAHSCCAPDVKRRPGTRSSLTAAVYAGAENSIRLEISGVSNRLRLLGGRNMTTWKFDPMHTQVEFSAKHLGMMTVRGHFNDVTTEAELDPDHPEKSSFSATIQTASIPTHNEQRDR